jgi:hypothetical protein
VARIRGGSSPARVGICVAGIYQDLLLRERESVARADAAAAGRARRGLGVFRRSRHLLDAGTRRAVEPILSPLTGVAR